MVATVLVLLSTQPLAAGPLAGNAWVMPVATLSEFMAKARKAVSVLLYLSDVCPSYALPECCCLLVPRMQGLSLFFFVLVLVLVHHELCYSLC